MKVRSSLSRRRAVGLALAACSLAIVMPAAASAPAAQNQDLRSADALDAAIAAAQPPVRTDLRSADALNASIAAAQPPLRTAVRTDLRSADALDSSIAAAQPPVRTAVRTDLPSPDARDAALAAETGAPSTAPSPVSARPTVVPVVDHGGQTLAIVFSSTALFLALLAIGFVAVYRRPRPRWSAS